MRTQPLEAGKEPSHRKANCSKNQPRMRALAHKGSTLCQQHTSVLEGTKRTWPPPRCPPPRHSLLLPAGTPRVPQCPPSCGTPPALPPHPSSGCICRTKETPTAWQRHMGTTKEPLEDAYMVKRSSLPAPSILVKAQPPPSSKHPGHRRNLTSAEGMPAQLRTPGRTLRRGASCHSALPELLARARWGSAVPRPQRARGQPCAEECGGERGRWSLPREQRGARSRRRKPQRGASPEPCPPLPPPNHCCPPLPACPGPSHPASCPPCASPAILPQGRHHQLESAQGAPSFLLPVAVPGPTQDLQSCPRLSAPHRGGARELKSRGT